jgi:transcriptional regulator with XRE-family HTH domain
MNNGNADAYKGFLEDIGTFSSKASEEAKPVAESKEAVPPPSLGQRVRLLRQERGLSAKDVCQRTGLNLEELERIETDAASPPLGVLIRIAKALDMKLGRFLSSGETKPFTVVRKDDRQVISRFTSAKDTEYGYTYESLAPDKKDRHMEPFMVRLMPSSGKRELSTHSGQEFIHVLEGDMEVTLDEKVEILHSGDSIYYDSTVPHLVRCHGEKETVILAVLYTEDG